MALYTNDSKERVRDAVDMVDLVSSRVELKRAGANRLTGLCPFHDERSPSFGINPAEKVYHCFGCQASGDAFTFVMETEGVDFKGALEHLADRYKVTLELEDEDPQAAERRKRRERLLEAGVAEDRLTRIAAPIGLDLGGLTAEETALSIMAEVVAVRNGREGGRLSTATGRIHEVGA
ncbi:MAG: XdhC family protein [Actinobacteria bacterium]|nr:XdhC family protein [Actinomycetota bacterium]